MQTRDRLVPASLAVTISLLAILLSGCASTNLSSYRTVEWRAEQIQQEQNAATHLRDLPFRSGQIVVREAGSSMGLVMDLMAADYLPFGHAGILISEADGLYVYDAFGLLSMQFWKPPTRRLSGGIRRLRLGEFISRGSVTAVYEHPDVAPADVAAFARNAYDNGVAFDAFFDYRTPDRVYCSEFVAQALHSAGHDSIVPAARTQNPSLLRVMDWLELDTPGFVLTGSLIDGATQVARISHNLSPAQIDAHFAFERELHRRFTADKKLAYLFRWTLLGPRKRPRLDALYEELMDGADAADDPDQWATRRIATLLGEPATQMAGR